MALGLAVSFDLKSLEIKTESPGGQEITLPVVINIGSFLAYLAANLITSYDIELPSEIYMVSRMSVTMKPEFFIYAMIFALMANFVAGLYPAWKASKMDPVEAIGE